MKLLFYSFLTISGTKEGVSVCKKHDRSPFLQNNIILYCCCIDKTSFFSNSFFFEQKVANSARGAKLTNVERLFKGSEAASHDRVLTNVIIVFL